MVYEELWNSKKVNKVNNYLLLLYKNILLFICEFLRPYKRKKIHKTNSAPMGIEPMTLEYLLQFPTSTKLC